MFWNLCKLAEMCSGFSSVLKSANCYGTWLLKPLQTPRKDEQMLQTFWAFVTWWHSKVIRISHQNKPFWVSSVIFYHVHVSSFRKTIIVFIASEVNTRCFIVFSYRKCVICPTALKLLTLQWLNSSCEEGELLDILHLQGRKDFRSPLCMQVAYVSKKVE